MPQPKRGLGKGLGALIPTGPAAAPATGSTVAEALPPGGTRTGDLRDRKSVV